MRIPTRTCVRDDSSVARAGAVYEIIDVETRDVLSRHRTRQAAIDNWREKHTGRAVQVWRRTVPNGETLIVEGVWHEPHRPGSRTPTLLLRSDRASTLRRAVVCAARSVSATGPYGRDATVPERRPAASFSSGQPPLCRAPGLHRRERAPRVPRRARRCDRCRSGCRLRYSLLRPVRNVAGLS